MRRHVYRRSRSVSSSRRQRRRRSRTPPRRASPPRRATPPNRVTRSPTRVRPRSRSLPRESQSSAADWVRWVPCDKDGRYMCAVNYCNTMEQVLQNSKSVAAHSVLDGNGVLSCCRDADCALDEPFATEYQFARAGSGRFEGLRFLAKGPNKASRLQALGLAAIVGGAAEGTDQGRPLNLTQHADLADLVAQALRLRPATAGDQCRPPLALPAAAPSVKSLEDARSEGQVRGGAGDQQHPERKATEEELVQLREELGKLQTELQQEEADKSALARQHRRALQEHDARRGAVVCESEARLEMVRESEARLKLVEREAAESQRELKSQLTHQREKSNGEMIAEFNAARQKDRQLQEMDDRRLRDEQFREIEDRRLRESLSRAQTQLAEHEESAALRHGRMSAELKDVQEEMAELKDVRDELVVRNDDVLELRQRLARAESETALADEAKRDLEQEVENVQCKLNQSELCNSETTSKRFPQGLRLEMTKWYIAEDENRQKNILQSVEPSHSTSMPSHSVLDTPDNHIILGTSEFATRLKDMCSMNVRYILNLNAGSKQGMRPELYRRINIIDVKRVVLDDVPTQNIISQLDEMHAFIDLAKLDNCKVLVHCHAGINRSGAVVLAYIMRRLAKEDPVLAQQSQELLRQAWGALAKKRWPVVTQQSFRLQLALWAECDFNAQRAMQHTVWDPLVFRCHASQMCGEAAQQFVDRIMVKESKQQRCFRLVTQEEIRIASQKINRFLDEKNPQRAASRNELLGL